MKYDMNIREEYHEIANYEPMMQLEEMDLLVEMLKNGYDKNQPITIYEGKILDGRNRYVACEYLGIEPATTTFKGNREEAEIESIRLNNARRHKSSGQKAMTAAYMVVSSRETKNKIPVQKCAKMHGISKRYVENAMNLLENDPTLANKVFAGEMTLSKALHTYREVEDLKAKAMRTGKDDAGYTDIQAKFAIAKKFMKKDPDIAAAMLISGEEQLFVKAEEAHRLKLEVRDLKDLLDEVGYKRPDIDVGLDEAAY